MFAVGRSSKRCTGRAGNRFCLRFELCAICAEIRHDVLKFDPVRDAQRRPLLGSVATKGDRIGLGSKGGALQNSVLAFLRDLRGLDDHGFFQEFGRNRNDFGAFPRAQALKSFRQFIGTCSEVHSLALIPQISSGK